MTKKIISITKKHNYITKKHVHDRGVKNAEKLDRNKPKRLYCNENTVGPFVGL